MKKVLAILLAGGAGSRLSLLCDERAKPAMPFGGIYRIVDFAMSNCVNSGLSEVAVIAQYNPRSLVRHIGIGKAWNLDRTNGGLSLLQPYISRGKAEWYKDTADAVYQNLDFIEEKNSDEVLILAGDHIYIMNYFDMVEFHRKRGADITVGVINVPADATQRFGILFLNHQGKIVKFTEKPKVYVGNLASMGIYVFNKKVLLDCLEENANSEGGHDFGKDIIPQALKYYNVYGYKFNGYWRDVGTVDAYWQANMDLIVDLPEINLYDPQSAILTNSILRPPLKMGPYSEASRSLLSDGCIVNGRVINSVLSPGVYVEKGAVIQDSIIFNDTYIESDVVVNRCIIDKNIHIGQGAVIGWGEDMTPNEEEPDNLYSGITLIGKGAQIPPEIRIGRNCKIGCWSTGNTIEGFLSGNREIPSGASIKSTPENRPRIMQ